MMAERKKAFEKCFMLLERLQALEGYWQKGRKEKISLY